MLPKMAYVVLGIPVQFHGIDYQDTKLIPSKIDTIRAKISKAPHSGVLLVSGTSAPVINQLMVERKTIGIDFVQYYNSKLSSEETMDLPKAPVVLIYNIGSEPANNASFAGKLLTSVMSLYKSSLVILETDKTPSNFITSYGISIQNTLIIPEKEVEKWV